MYRSIYTFLIAAVTLNLVVVNGIDVSQYKNVRLDFQSSDSVDPAESVSVFQLDRLSIRTE